VAYRRMIMLLLLALVAAGCAVSTSPSQSAHVPNGSQLGAAKASDQASSTSVPSTTDLPNSTTTTSSKTGHTTAASTSTTSTSTTTTSSAVRTKPSVSTTTVAEPDESSTTTTGVAGVAACVWSNFSSTVTTDRSLYLSGQVVQIVLTYMNDGPACTVSSSGYGCPTVEIDNVSGRQVWSSSPLVTTGCAEVSTPPTVLDSGWSKSNDYPWHQTESCTFQSGPNCAAQQVPAGQYQVIGYDTGGSSQISKSAPTEIGIL
jgi:hypothetical protein